jgi:hypothetical protein
MFSPAGHPVMDCGKKHKRPPIGGRLLYGFLKTPSYRKFHASFFSVLAALMQLVVIQFFSCQFITSNTEPPKGIMESNPTRFRNKTAQLRRNEDSPLHKSLMTNQ